MTHGHAHEEAEHAAHHREGSFDRRVAMSMVVVAAILAGVKVQGHRTHNDVLGYQIKANVAHTQASNLFSFFQAKRQRMELALLRARQMADIGLLTRDQEKGPKDDKKKSSAPVEKGLPEKAERRARILKNLEEENVEGAEAQADKIVAKGEKVYRDLRKQRFDQRRATEIASLEMDVLRYRQEADAINARAKKELKKAEEYQKKSEHKHHQAAYFDLGELGVELALVLCSVAILTKRPPFWFGGLAVGGVGLVVVLVGLFR
jgi:hypothetical protein